MPSTSTFCVCYNNIDLIELQLLVGYSISQSKENQFTKKRKINIILIF